MRLDVIEVGGRFEWIIFPIQILAPPTKFN